MHRFKRGMPNGSPYGPRFEKLLRAPSTREYIMIGNENVHSKMDGMQGEWRVIRGRPVPLFSRASDPEMDVVYRWMR